MDEVARAIVIGYGNDLRSDDGAGRWVADRVEELRLPGVDVRSMSQLTPEIALEVGGREVVVFVDASVDTSELRIEQVEPGSEGSVMTHHGDPATVLSMVRAVGEPPTSAYLVSIPASNLEMGFAMTSSTRAAAERAVDEIRRLVS